MPLHCDLITLHVRRAGLEPAKDKSRCSFL